MNYSMQFPSPVGTLTAVSSSTHLIGLWIEGQKYFAEGLTEEPVIQMTPVLIRTREWLERYFAGKRPDIAELPLALYGSTFRQKVWKILCEIPYGSVTTYGEIAKRIAKEEGMCSMSAQAVGGAVGHNPISITVPCHRVVGKNGSLTGYAGGLEIKKRLLELEGAKF